MQKIFSFAKNSSRRVGHVMSRPKNIAAATRYGSNATFLAGTGLSLMGMPEAGVPLLAASKGLGMASQSISKGREINKDRRLLKQSYKRA
ncbi:MAG: hypothetical protein RLY43_2190 [Bacteroidota bacterium]